MTGDQLIVFAVLAASLALFVWNRWRYDVVAVLALLVVAVLGIVPPGEVFSGFGHPAVVTVAAVLVLSRGLLNAGVVDTLAHQLTRVGDRPWIQVAALTGIVVLSSGFMNNVGALALFMPVAIWMARQNGRSPSFLLMPLAFGSLLGGMLTLIGTPPNIIIAAYREETGMPPFGLFDFLPVGLVVAAAGLAFIALVGWRLLPRRQQPNDTKDLFEISAYLTELRVPEGGKYAGRTLHELLAAVEDVADVMVVALVRAGHWLDMPSPYEVLQEHDIMLAEADSDSLKAVLDLSGLELAEKVGGGNQAEPAGEHKTGRVVPGELNLSEAIVSLDSRLVGRSASSMDLRRTHGVNVLAVARQGQRLRQRLGKIRFAAGDILLVQGEDAVLSSALNTLGCLPLASRGLRIGRPRKVLLASGIFAGALVLIALGLVPAATALVAAAVVMVLTKLVSTKEIYTSIDLPVLVLLAALLPVGHALETTGGSQLIADGLYSFGKTASPALMLAVLMVAVMLLSNVVNNAAAVVLAAPVAIRLAQSTGVSADPFLMAVAIGASCAFLTPIGHQSNTLVMVPGGYKFGDYWRMGLPLSILVVGTAVPAILRFWPL